MYGMCMYMCMCGMYVHTCDVFAHVCAHAHVWGVYMYMWCVCVQEHVWCVCTCTCVVCVHTCMLREGKELQNQYIRRKQ